MRVSAWLCQMMALRRVRRTGGGHLIFRGLLAYNLPLRDDILDGWGQRHGSSCEWCFLCWSQEMQRRGTEQGVSRRMTSQGASQMLQLEEVS